MQDTIFRDIDDAPCQPQPPITIYTTGSAGEDLQALLYRINAGDTPSTRELVAILEDVHVNMMEGRV